MEQVERFTYMKIVNRMLMGVAVLFIAAYMAQRVGYIERDAFKTAVYFVAVFAVAPFLIAALEQQTERSVQSERLSDARIAQLATQFGYDAERSGNLIVFKPKWDNGPLRQHMKVYLVQDESELRIVGPRRKIAKIAVALRTELDQ